MPTENCVRLYIRCHVFLSNFNEEEIFNQILEEFSNIKFSKNSFSVSSIITSTYRQTEKEQVNR